MKTKAIYSILIILLCVLCACGRNKNKTHNSDNSAMKEIVIPNESGSGIKASSFIENYKIIQLATSADNLIFQISKVQYVHEKIYILDVPANCIFIFNKDGALHKKLNKRGAGPGEYVQITDFYIDEEGLLHVMDFTQKAILRYNNDLEYVGKTEIASLARMFIYHHNRYWSYNEPIFKKANYQFSSFAKDGTGLKNFLARKPVESKYNWSGVNTFATDGTKKYLSPSFNDTIYSIDNDDIKPEFVINFKDREFPENKSVNEYDITAPDFPFFIKWNFYVSSKYLIFDYIVKRQRWFAVYDIEKNSTHYGEVENDLIENFRFFPRWGNDDFLIEELGSEVLLEHFSSSSAFETFIHGSEDDNPLIIIYKLKK